MSYHAFIKSLLLLLFALSVAQAQELTQQRQTYRLAQLALKAGQIEVFRRFQAQLKDYPLYPYLVYEELKRRLASAPDAEIEGFLETYADTPLASLMRGHWLYQLYRQDRWAEFLEVYDGRAVAEFMCYDLRARIRAQQFEGVFEGAQQLWLVGASQHSACDRLFEWFATQPEFTPALVWRRIELAMAAGNPGLATYLAQRLDAEDRAWVALWQRAHLSPRTVVEEPTLQSNEPIARKILMHAALRLADQDVELGRSTWAQIKSEHAFEARERDEIDRNIALLAAYRHHPEADDWLAALPVSAQNDDVHTWRARMAMREGDWRTLKTSIQALEDTSDEPLMWRYWYARALEGLGETENAGTLYTTLAGERDYYGFLAADRLDAPYAIVNIPLVDDPAAAGALIDVPGVRRAYELLRVNAETDARREWNHVLNGMPLEQKKLAAVLASKWGWHSDAIRTVAGIGELDDLELRFPTPYLDEIMAAAANRKLDPAWIYGIMRRESAFAARAYSSAGAQGLMQLMPATAELTARKFGLPPPSGNDVFDPARNIALGSAYLSEMLKRFQGNQALATAAYNAGPHRVERWLPERGALPADVWVEIIPFYETRDYVKAVLAYAAVYESKLNEHVITPLVQRMEPIPLAAHAYANR
jgi:soluble lytic murein transglycosylase